MNGILLAESVDYTPAAIIVASIFAAVWTGIQVLDRLYFGPTKKQSEPSGCRSDQTMDCKFDHNTIKQEQTRQAKILDNLADAQATLIQSVSELVTIQKNSLEVEKIRHAQVISEIKEKKAG